MIIYAARLIQSILRIFLLHQSGADRIWRRMGEMLTLGDDVGAHVDLPKTQTRKRQ